MTQRDPMRVPTGLIVLMAVQSICAVFFVTDAVQDYFEEGGLGSLDWHLAFETAATLSLLVAIAIEGRIVMDLLRKKMDLEQSLHHASAEVEAVINAQFEAWRLSPAETDIALFLVKGLGTQEIAEMRGSAEGTIKAHFNAIFRKAGVHSRTELLSVLIDLLLGSRLDTEDAVPDLRKSG